MLNVFCSPLRYVQGAGAMRRLGAEMVAVGLEGPVLIVAGSTAIARLAPTWAAALEDAGMSHRVRLFGGESSRREIAAIVDEAKSFGARTIVAAGGGKVLDAARSAAAALRLPFASCPTICSTDAPTSALSVLVLVDTQVIAESPPRFLAAGIGDAMSTWYEGRAAAAASRPNMRGGRATLAALELARLCRDTVFEDGEAALAECREGRAGASLERVAEAATLLSGLGFESAGLAAAHAVHNGLTAIAATHEMLHGEKVAFGTLVQLLLEAHATPDAAVREATLAEANRVAAFFVQVGLPVTLGELGIGDEGAAAVATVIRRIASRATEPGETIHNMPFPVDVESVAAAIQAADAVGRAALRPAAG